MNKLLKILKQHFGYDNFRGGQEEIIRSILACKDTLAVMPTGGGKSLCYQLPSLVTSGTVLVISPLIALMKDQVDALQKSGVSATSIDSTLSFADIQNRFVAASQGVFKLIYVAPERLESRLFLELLQSIEIPFIAIDEAHCISEWGHDFRPSYLNVHKIFDFIPRCPVLALTATATKEVREDIVRALKMNNPELVIKGFERKNLQYFTEFCENKLNRVADICSRTKSGSTIIYAGSRKRVEQFSQMLNEAGIKSEPYHAGMKVLMRTAVQDRFITGRTKVIVATNAFGMGIDKYDVRNVVHIDYPLSIESYYQEAGRAGRDGNPSDCYLLVHHDDKDLPEYFIRSTFPSKEDIEQIFDAIISWVRTANENETKSISIPTPLILANSIQRDYRTVESVYNLLSRAGTISKGNVQNQPRIRITTNRERIQEYYTNLIAERQQALEAILRSVSSDVFERFVPINIKDIMQKHGVSKNAFDDIIKSLQMLNLAKFVSDGSLSGYYLDKFYENINDIPVDFEKLRERYIFALKKLDKVYEYAETNICKRNFVLDYFDDFSYEGTCKNCSSCKDNQIKNRLITSSSSLLKNGILNYLHSTKQEIGITELITGLQRYYNEIKISEFCNLKSDDFRKQAEFEIQRLIQRRLVKYSYSYKQIISITPDGVEFIKDLPEHFKVMARREKDKTESEIIFSKLVTLRREIAEHAGVVPRGIISDVALKKIAEVMPETEYDLKNVSGVSQLFVQKFAKLFLQELAKIKLNPKEHKVSKVAQDTLKMLAQGQDFDTIKSRLFGGSLAMSSNYIIEILEAGHTLPRKSIIPDAVYTKVRTCVKKFPEFGARDLQSKLTLEVDSTTLKIAVAFAKAELGID